MAVSMLMYLRSTDLVQILLEVSPRQDLESLLQAIIKAQAEGHPACVCHAGHACHVHYASLCPITHEKNGAYMAIVLFYNRCTTYDIPMPIICPPTLGHWRRPQELRIIGGQRRGAVILQNREIHGSPLAETSLIRNTLPATAWKSPSKSLAEKSGTSLGHASSTPCFPNESHPQFPNIHTSMEPNRCHWKVNDYCI